MSESALKTSNAQAALVAGLTDAGCGYVSNFPGSHSQEIFFALGGERISLNERIAFETAYGASLAGLRSVVTMKSVGLNACADPFLHSVISGVQGGLVVVVSDDTKVVASQERADSRHFIDFFGGLWLEPSTVKMAYEMAYDAFALSEDLDVPVVIRLTNQFFDATGEYEPRPVIKNTLGLASVPEKFISYPVYWKRQSENLKMKNSRISEYVEKYYSTAKFNSDENVGVLVVGSCGEELSGIPDQMFDILSVNTYPLPKELISRFAQGRTKLLVLEQGDNYGAKWITSELGQSCLPYRLESVTGDCPDYPDQWHEWSHLEKLFAALKRIRPAFVIGDVGQYTVESTHTIGSCLCLGSAVGTTLGMAEAGVEFPFCVVGDGAFLHSNTQALDEALTRNAKFGAIVIDNNGSAATGGQPLAADIRKIDQAITVYEIDYLQASAEYIEETLIKIREAGELAVLFVTIPKQDSK